MLTEADQRHEELESILASAIFRKAPNQSRLLRYLCEKSFERQLEPLKEHQIAVEALGRKDSFDERENSIVRVEVSRLRKRLRQYYETEGRRHTLRIAIDPGQYITRFISAEVEMMEPEPVLPAGADETLDAEAAAAEIAPRRSRHLLIWVVTLGAVIVAAAVVQAVWTRNSPAVARQKEAPSRIAPAEPLLPSASAEAVRILAGFDRPIHIDPYGRYWHGDMDFSGGQAAAAPRQFLARTLDPTPFRHYRVGNFAYNIPLKPGAYEMRLYFGPGVGAWSLEQRPEGYAIVLFINGSDYMFYLNFNADGTAGPTPDVRVFKNISPAADGVLHLQFKSANQYDFVNAIEITPGVRGRLLPIRFSSRGYSYTDVSGKIWDADRYVRGGTLVERRDPVIGTNDPGLFSGERFGNFDYLVPVAPGTYAVELGMAETWYGPTMPGGGGPGSRFFNVSCNNTPLLKDFDVYRAAGGANRALVKTFHGLQPDSDGRLRLSFSSPADNAMVNFVEIRDESK